MKPHRVYLALGANIAPMKANIDKACLLLATKIDDIKMAPVYETKPWGFEDQENFLNTALRGDTDLTPEELLEFTQEVEREVGRVKRFQNGPREIDIDILLYDDVVLNTPRLQVPHPRMHERDFALQPLADLDEDLVHPVLGVSVRDLLRDLKGERYVIKTYEE